ncbi:hypothetical protein ACFL96_06385 [Thermoproteota archaeon]
MHIGFSKQQLMALLGMVGVVLLILFINFFLELKVTPIIPIKFKQVPGVNNLGDPKPSWFNQDKKEEGASKSAQVMTNDPRRYGIVTFSEDELKDLSPEDNQAMLDAKVNEIVFNLSDKVREKVYKIVRDPDRSKALFEDIEKSLKECDELLAKDSSDSYALARKNYLLIRKAIYSTAQQNAL